MISEGKLKFDANYYNEVADIINRKGITTIGFNTRCDSYPGVLNIAKKCKLLNPKLTIILGGPQATFVDVETLERFPFVEIIIRGEEGFTILDLVNKLRNQEDLTDVAGITYRKENGYLKRNEDRELIENLDLLPFPAYHLIKKKYWNRDIVAPIYLTFPFII